jgi:hypothetical protein
LSTALTPSLRKNCWNTNPIQRDRRDRTSGSKGAGLGLSIVRSVAQAPVYTQAGETGGLVVGVWLPIAH